ncbi:hypothetical protein MASR2M17_09010 [Aminivibrio sp.]
MAPIPAYFMAMGAWSREEPQPKLLPAAMMSPGVTLWAKPGAISSKTCSARVVKSRVFVYFPAMM